MRKLLGTVVVALLALSGCGEGVVHTGAAAVVGDRRISDSRLVSMIGEAKLNETAAKAIAQDEASFTRQELSRLVNHEVLTAAAGRQGVTVTEGDVDARLAEFAQQAGGQDQLETQAAENGLPQSQLRDFVRDLALQQALGDALSAADQPDEAALRAAYQQQPATYDQARASHILVADKALADQILAQAKADPAAFPELAKQYSTDPGSKDLGGDLGLKPRGTFVPEFDAAVFGGQPGDIVEVQTQFGFHVIKIEERKTTSFEEAEPELRRTATRDTRDRKVADLLRSTAKDLGVTVNPRYGRYDAEQAQVVATESEVSRPDGSGGQSGDNPGTGPVGGEEPGPAQPSP